MTTGCGLIFSSGGTAGSTTVNAYSMRALASTNFCISVSTKLYMTRFSSTTVVLFYLPVQILDTAFGLRARALTHALVRQRDETVRPLGCNRWVMPVDRDGRYSLQRIRTDRQYRVLKVLHSMPKGVLTASLKKRLFEAPLFHEELDKVARFKHRNRFLALTLL